MTRFRLLIPLLICVLLLSACAAGDEDEPYTISVLLSVPTGVSVVSENPCAVTPGGNAVFTLEVSPGYDVTPPAGATYENGILTVRDVQFPTTVSLSVRYDPNLWAGVDPTQIPASGSFSFSTAKDSGRGTVTATHESGKYDAGTRITVTAAPDENSRFVCWSAGNAVSAGGTPLAYTPGYTFLLGMDLELWANFAQAGTATLIYDTNGGTARETGFSFLRDDSDVSHYITPHTLPSRGQMAREGYVLYAYNTAPDGSGREYTFGANVPIKAGETALLYAMWAPVDESVFTYTVSANRVYITGCSSDAETVVIPETIEGKKVERIQSGAFDGLTNLRTLITNPNIQIYARGSLKNCPNFTTLYLCDSVKVIPNNFYENCPEFQTLKVGAVRLPAYMGKRNGNYAIKFQRLITAEGPKLIFVSGSSCAYGINSPRVEELLEHRYAVVNYGTNYGNPAVFYMEVVAAFVNPGDVIVNAPEPHIQQLGENEIISTTWQIFEGALEAFSYVDIRNYYNVFSSLTAFNDSRSKMKAGSYADYCNQELNIWGDCAYFRANQTRRHALSQNALTFNPDMLTAARAERLNARYQLFRDKGATVLLSFAPINVEHLTRAGKTEGNQLAYQNHLEKNLTAVRITDLADCIYESTYIYTDFDMHLTTEGATIRSEMLAGQIKAHLESVGLW